MTLRPIQMIIGAACLSLIGSHALAQQTNYADPPLKTSPTGFTRPSIDSLDTQDDFLDVDAAFIANASIQNEVVELRWDLAENYYLYQHSIKIYAVDDLGNRTDVAADFEPSQALRKTDPYFGQVRVYYNQASYTSRGRPNSGTLEVHYQGCADLGLCYPTQKRTLVY